MQSDDFQVIQLFKRISHEKVKLIKYAVIIAIHSIILLAKMLLKNMGVYMAIVCGFVYSV